MNYGVLAAHRPYDAVRQWNGVKPRHTRSGVGGTFTALTVSALLGLVDRGAFVAESTKRCEWVAVTLLPPVVLRVGLLEGYAPKSLVQYESRPLEVPAGVSNQTSEVLLQTTGRPSSSRKGRRRALAGLVLGYLGVGLLLLCIAGALAGA